MSNRRKAIKAWKRYDRKLLRQGFDESNGAPERRIAVPPFPDPRGPREEDWRFWQMHDYTTGRDDS